MCIVMGMLLFLRGLVSDRARLAAENLALRQQVAVLKRTNPRPTLRRRDRVFWAWLARLWGEWRSVLAIVQPETVVRWHLEGPLLPIVDFGRRAAPPLRPRRLRRCPIQPLRKAWCQGRVGPRLTGRGATPGPETQAVSGTFTHLLDGENEPCAQDGAGLGGPVWRPVVHGRTENTSRDGWLAWLADGYVSPTSWRKAGTSSSSIQ